MPGACRRRHLALSCALVLSLALCGCGLKGALYLPQQKKSRVPATQSNPTPETPEAPPTAVPPASAPDAPSPPGDIPPHA